MLPNDDSGKLPRNERPFRVLLALCLWPCNCYEKNSKAEPDLMWDLDMYARLDLADAWAMVGPVNWYGPSRNLKLMFDRLLCMNGGNPREDLIAHKDPEKAMALEHDTTWEALSLNHLEGRTAAFFCCGDGGGDELEATGRLTILQHKAYFDPSGEPFQDMRQTYAPLVWQCRYGGVEVPDSLWAYCEFGKGKKYSDNQAEDMIRRKDVLETFDRWTDDFASFVQDKGKVTPGKYRAYGHQAPGHLLRDAQLLWRDIRMQAGVPPKDSSPAQQREKGLNVDQTWSSHESEGEKLRRKK